MLAERFDTTPIVAPRVALSLEYNGSAYHGWQRQKKPAVPTIQSSLEAALSSVAGSDIGVFCAGRTDARVHATQQIVHFENTVQRSAKAWVMGTNANLPDDIRVHWAMGMSGDFHARFSATARRYRYIIVNTPVRSGIFSGQLSWFRSPLDYRIMHSEAQCLLGEQDFSAFRAAACQSNSAFRNVHAIHVAQHGNLIVIDIEANAFLLHMVRNIAGVLMDVGAGRQAPGWTKAVLEGKDRNHGCVTAAPQGLYLVDVQYPAHFAMKKSPIGPYFLSS